MTANVSGAAAPKTFVLIPGAGADPRVYGATIDALRDLGHDGIAPPLPLEEPDATPRDHADAIVAALGHPPPAPVVVDVDVDVDPASAEYEGQPSRGLFAEPFPVVRWPYRPTTVLAPREDRLFPLEFQRRLARERLGPGVKVVEVDGGHLPFLSRPRDLAARLVELAGAN